MYKYRHMRFGLLQECNEELLFRHMSQNKLIKVNERVHQMVKTFEKTLGDDTDVKRFLKIPSRFKIEPPPKTMVAGSILPAATIVLCLSGIYTKLEVDTIFLHFFLSMFFGDMALRRKKGLTALA